MTKQLKEIEIPFGAKDSELCDWEYAIPEGMEATIVDNKIVVKKKESGDEKIRKEFIQYLKECTNLPSGQYCRADFFDWLEKQGEQKSITIDIDKMVYEFAHTEVKGYGMPAMIEVDAYRKGVNDALCLSLNIEKQGEHKPFDYENANIQQKDFAPKVEPKFKVGDTVRFKGNETLKGEAETHKIVGYDNELYVFADGTTDLFCEQELYELVEQKSIAWSEEDEDMLQSILDEYKSMTTEKRNWLKSLKDRFGCEVNCTTTKAWSEEDEGFLDSALWHIQNSITNGNIKAFVECPLSTWLKSIKDRIQPQNAWKPSVEQMKVLSKYAEQNNYDGSVLTSLYQDLKKLREE